MPQKIPDKFQRNSIEIAGFGDLLKQLRKRAGMTQRDLAAALNCSDSLISLLENAQGQPDLETVISQFIPALGLQDDPATAALLVERAAAARGERPPTSITFQRSSQLVIQEQLPEEGGALPSQPTELIGRSEDVNQLCNRLLGHSGRLVTLIGPPGIGKTRLALAVAARLQYTYADGILFVPLAEIPDPVLMASTIYISLGGSDTGPKPLQSKLIEFLRRKSMLLVLDNCEQIGGAGELVAALLAACGALVILATSRERLHLRAEQRYRVPPLEVADAVELFARRAAAVDGGFALTETNRPTVEVICRRLDRLPLALELCAAQVDLLSLPQILSHLNERRLELLVDGAGDLPPRQRTLRLAIEHSYTLLTHDERTLFRNLGVFAGGFAWPELEAMSVGEQPPQAPSGTLSTLHALIGKSLVRAESTPSGEQRFYLLEMIRDFALDKLRAAGEEQALRALHFSTYLHLFHRADRPLRGPEDARWLARLDLEVDNLRAALQWALTSERQAQAAWSMAAISYFWVRSGRGYEEARWIAQLLPARYLLAAEARVALLLTFYRSAFALEEFQPVAHYLTEALQLLEHCDHKRLHATALCFRAWTMSDPLQAAAAIEEGIALFRVAIASQSSSDDFGACDDEAFSLATHLWGYAVFLLDQGEVERAAPVAAESLALYRAQGNRTGIGECTGILGRLALLRGDIAQAHKLFQEVMSFASTLNYTAMQCEWQALLAITTLYQGDAVEARRLLTDSLRSTLDQKNRILLAQVSTYLAETALWEGDLDQASHWLAQSLSYHTPSHRLTMYDVMQLLIAARLATAQQQYVQAAKLFGLAEQTHGRFHYTLAEPLRVQSDAALATVRAALEPALFAQSFSGGQQLALADAFSMLAESIQKDDEIANAASATAGLRGRRP